MNKNSVQIPMRSNIKMRKAENVSQTSKNRSKNKCAGIKKYFTEYTQYTSLPCVQYLGENKRTLLEKILWTVLIMMSIAAGAYFIWQAYKKWDESPILIAIADIKPIEDITFPAITICPATKVNEDLMEIINKFGKDYQGNVSESDKLLYKYVNHWCTFDADQYNLVGIYLEEAYDMDILNFIYKNSPTIYDVFEECKWHYSANCSDLFTPTFTEEGICFTFNSLNHSDIFKTDIITFEDFNMARNTSCFEKVSEEYKEDCKEDAYPYRISPQNHGGLEVVLKMTKNHSSPCMESERGHKIIIHLPNELPHLEDGSFYVNPYESVNVDLFPELTITDENLRAYKPLKRKCFYDDEKDLRYFQYYTQNNCKRECYSAAAEMLHNCSLYFLRRNTSISICNPIRDLMIRYDGRLDIINHHVSRGDVNAMKIINKQHEDEFSKFLYNCVCFHSCKELKYNFKVTCTDCNRRIKKAPPYKNKDTTYYSTLRINFKNIEISPSTRYAQFVLMDFIAYCGGLLGFFIGFTFVSFWEICYFFCCRPLCNMYLYGRKYWMGRSKSQSSNHHFETIQS